nr:PIN domain-containing protein [Ferroglobus sp.]
MKTKYRSFSRCCNLLPNDALILATCKFYGIKYLISFDNDFRGACEGENMVLIDSVEGVRNEDS